MSFSLFFFLVAFYLRQSAHCLVIFFFRAGVRSTHTLGYLTFIKSPSFFLDSQIGKSGEWERAGDWLGLAPR